MRLADRAGEPRRRGARRDGDPVPGIAPISPSQDFPDDHPVDETEVETVEVGLGRRVLVVGDFLLGPVATPSSLALTADLSRTLERWQGPGLVIVCGNLLEGPGGGGRSDRSDVDEVLTAHPDLDTALRSFTADPGHRVIVLPGWRDPQLAGGSDRRALEDRGADVRGAVELWLETGAGVRRVLVRAGRPMAPTGTQPGAAGTREWLAGGDRLEDPGAAAAFVSSRILYRRLAPFSWLLFLPALVALVLRLGFVVNALERTIGHGAGARHALSRAYAATWPDRLLVAAGATVVLLLVFALVQLLLSRPVWRALGGGPLRRPRSADFPPLTDPPASGLALDGRSALDQARQLVAAGLDGVIVGGGLRAELVHLEPGFFAAPGGTTELVREHAGRLGLPPVFAHHCQASAVELETGATLHARLLYGEVDLPTSTAYERLCAADRVMKGRKPAADVRTALVASWPQGASWPPAPEVAADRIRARRVRRIAATAMLAAGIVDLVEAVGPASRGDLRSVEQVLSLGGVEAARALVAFAGIALIMLARGILHGQRRWWLVATGVLAATLALHLLDGASIDGLVLTGAVLVLLVIERRHFGAAIDHRSWRSALTTLVVGGATAIAAAVIAIEVGPHRTPLPPWPEVVGACVERLAGFQTIFLPERVNRWAAPALLGVGAALLLVVAFLGTRPVVDRRLSSGRGGTARRMAEARARDIVHRHGTGSLDYFALRDDKQWFFHRDSLIAYAVYGGVCLVSPDPIGPHSDRAHAWGAFRRFADQHGWAVGVVAAAEEWLPVFRDSGMRFAYVGDEAIVDLQRFSLAGNKMKGLRQACSRLERNGYWVECGDPSEMDPTVVERALELVRQNRRGDHERGFSMTLGRVFDARDSGLLLTIVQNAEGAPVAVCQFVPAPAIGGYSLDLMRRDPGEHPNGLIDFALCSTIRHLADRGHRGLSLNFAAMRSTLEGGGNGLAQRVERWALRRMSSVLQIESLWRFNAKYEPTWLPRYVVFDSAEHFLPTLLTIARAESLTDVPLVGRLLAPAAERRRGSLALGAGQDLPDAASG